MTNLDQALLQALLDEAKNTGKPVSEVLAGLVSACLFEHIGTDLHVNGVEFGKAMSEQEKQQREG